MRSTFTNNLDKYFVIGNPIDHSLSPEIHQQFAEQTQQSISYQRLLVKLGTLPAVLDQLRAAGVKGVNITLPFKQEAFHYADQLTERAKIAKAVNTLVFKDNYCLGDNTDGVGLIEDLCGRLRWQILEKKILILGAGGAVRGVLKPLLDQHPALVIIANRTIAKATQMAQDFQDYSAAVQAYNALIDLTPFDVIINAISTPNFPALPSNLIKPETCCYDLSYHTTAFQTWAIKNGCHHFANGLGMLVAQAAEAFYLWRGIKPDSHTVLSYLTGKLK
jgi:shikimate dehydrogenase